MIDLLKNVAVYSSDRINISELDIETYVSTENILQNKLGKTIATKLPASTNFVTKYTPGDILIGNIRPYLKKIWFAVNEGGSSADVLTIKVKSNSDPRFIYYALLRDDFFDYVMAGSKGTKMPRGDKNQVMNFKIPKFNLNTQSQIAKVLSDLDAKIELNNKINAELEAMAKLIYDYWFVQFEFPHEFKIEKTDKEGRRTELVEVKPYKSSGVKMVWNEELKREIPEGWESGTLNDIGEIIGGSTPSKAINANFCQGKGLPWITPKDLSLNKGKKFITRGEWDVTDRGQKEGSLKIMPAGTILLSSRAPIGYLAIARGDVTTNQGFKSFVPKNNFSSEFIFYTVQNLIPEIEANSSGSTFQEVSTGTLRTIKTVLPTSGVLSSYDQKVKPIFKQQNILETQNQKLAELRDWLLPMLMNGQVKVEKLGKKNMNN